MYFRQNSEIISRKNPVLAQELSQMFLVLAEENIEVYRAETGDYVFSYEGLALDDMVNPKEDAALNFSENVPSDFTEDDIVIVFGLGTGYLFNYAVENTSARVILWEPKTDIFRYGAEFLDISENLSKSNVFIVGDELELSLLVKKLYAKEKSSVVVIYPDAYAQLLPDILDKLLSDVTEFVSKG